MINLESADAPTRSDESATKLDALKDEIVRLQILLAKERERARVAEEQLLRVHRSVRAAQQTARAAKENRVKVLEGAQRHASQLVRQAQMEADRIIEEANAASTGPQTKLPAPPAAARPSTGDGARPPASPFASLSREDPTLDDRLDQYLMNDMEPDPSRDWILGDRSG